MSANLETMPYQVQATVSYEHKDEFLEKLEDVSDIDNYYCVNNEFFTVSSDENSSLRNKIILLRVTVNSLIRNVISLLTLLMIKFQ